MQKTVVLNVVGLTPGLLGEHTPFLTSWADSGTMMPVEPVLPAVTCSVQASYLTGTWPSAHGIVGNGWYFRDTGEVRFWMRSGRLIQQPKVWEAARKLDSEFTCANLFWRYAAYSGADYVVVERPMYPADGRKIPDVYTWPSPLRHTLNARLGRFPLFEFWGPNTTIRSSQWIADAAKVVEEEYGPTLTLVYLPHLDYDLQRLGPGDPDVAAALRDVDGVCEDLITFYETRGADVLVLSEYGITPVHRSVSLNRVLRRQGYLAIRDEVGGELLDAGASTAFAVADHQLAHVYVNDPEQVGAVSDLLAAVPGVDRVLGAEGKAAHHLDHPRSGDLVAVAEPDAWFTYYYWLDEDQAPDFAPTVDIHRKPGYDPVELFVDPELRFPKLRVARRLLQKKLGFRYLMDVIPTDPSLVKGSHGCLPASPQDGPLVISRQILPEAGDAIQAVGVHDLILKHLAPGYERETAASRSR